VCDVDFECMCCGLEQEVVCGRREYAMRVWKEEGERLFMEEGGQEVSSHGVLSECPELNVILK
jgi:hypothetical protein